MHIRRDLVSVREKLNSYKLCSSIPEIQQNYGNSLEFINLLLHDLSENAPRLEKALRCPLYPDIHEDENMQTEKDLFPYQIDEKIVTPETGWEARGGP